MRALAGIVEVICRELAAHAGGVSCVQNIEVGFQVRLHLVAGLKHNVAVGQGFLGQGSLGYNAVLLAQGSSVFQVGVGSFHAGFVAVHKGGKAGGVSFHSILAGDQNAGYQLGAGNFFPLFVHIQGNAQAFDLSQCAGHKGLGQHGDRAGAGLQLSQSLGCFAVEVKGHIVIRVNTVFSQDVAQNIFRGGTLAGCHDGLALQVLHAVHSLAVFHNIQHAQGVDAGNLNGAVGFLVQGCGQVSGHSGCVQLALYQLRHDFIGLAVHFKVIISGIFACHQVHKAHGGGAFQAGNAQSIGGGQFLGFLTGSGFRSSLGDSFAGSCTGCNRAGCRTAAGGNGGSRKPPRDDDDAPRKAKGRKSGKKGSSGKGGNGKKKKKIRWWQILLITLLVIALIFGGAFALIMGAITPAGGNIKLNQLINTPKEFQGKEFNILVTGVDRSSTGDLSAGAANDSNVNDGMTDMILYVHFNNETGEMKMLQIPRDTMVTTDASVSGNYRINGVAKTQGSDGNNNMAALCELVADQYKLPIDGFMTIRLEMLTELVDLFGGVEINVPMDVDYAALGLGDSVIHAGYQTLNGASMEFLLRARKIYPDGDIGRLNMQRQFYAALFRKLKSIGNIWDVAKLTPAVLNYMETNLSASDLISFAISMLKIDSSKIMICQMPVISGPQYNGQSLLYPARQADADLLNQYFRENTGPVDASQLNLCDNVIDLSGYTATDPNIQQMGGLMAEADDAQKNENLDGSNQVTDIMASESTAESESTDTDSTDTESQPAA